MKNQTRMHFVHSELITPADPVSINLIGAGGTGTAMLTALGRINYTLNALQHPGLHVTLYDSDHIEQPNIGRQNFAQSEIGLNKAVASINKVNAFFGTYWKAKPEDFSASTAKQANFTISCVDTAKARLNISDLLQTSKNQGHTGRMPLYWLDLGNSRSTGQFILGTLRQITQPTNSRSYIPVAELPTVVQAYGDQLREPEKNQEPSCSTFEALQKQDLFINSCLADHAGNYLFNFLRLKMTPYRGMFLNLETMVTQPIKV